MAHKSNAVRVFVWLFLAGQVCFFILSWSPVVISVQGVSMQMAPGGMDFHEARTLANTPRLWGVLLASPGMVALAFAVWRLDMLLRVRIPRSMFSVSNIGHLRAFAGAAVLTTVWSIMELPARGLVFRHLSDTVQDRIKVSVSSDQLLLLLVCVVFFLVADLMHEARRLAQENEGFV